MVRVLWGIIRYFLAAAAGLLYFITRDGKFLMAMWFFFLASVEGSPDV